MADAIAAFGRLLARCPHLPDCWFNLAVLQRQAGQFTAALASYQKALDLGVTRPEEAHLNRGAIYSDQLRQDDAAERELMAALKLNPEYQPALLNLANLYEDLGRRPQAQRVYERLLTLKPTAFEALARYANTHSFPLSDDALTRRLRSALAHPSATTADRASLGFALGRLLDGKGDYEGAFEAYTQANHDSRASAAPRGICYERSRHEHLVERLMASPVIQGSTIDTSPQPIFICGLFRSGSTLTEQLLANHPDVAAGGELELLPRMVARELAPFPQSMTSLSALRAEGLAARYLGELRQIFPGALRVTDKRPDNFLYIGVIKSLFPGAKIIHTTRDPLDNCLSIFFLHLDHSMAYALDLADIGHYYRQQHRLMQHWKRLFGADILDFHYDAFVRDPAKEGMKLFDFLGLQWDKQYLQPLKAARAVKTASVWQVREPIHQRSSGRASHYARHLAGLHEYLKDLLPPAT